MKSFVRLMSVVIAFAMVITCAAVALNVTAFAEEDKPVYVQKFTADNFQGYYKYTEGTPGTNEKVSLTTAADNITFNEDGSVTMLTDDYKNKGLRLYFDIDDDFKSKMNDAKKIADDTYKANVEAAKQAAKDAGEEFDEKTVAKVEPKYNGYFRVDRSRTKAGYDKDAFVYYGFVMKDGSLLPCAENGGTVYQKKTISWSFRGKPFAGDHLKDGDFTYIENYDDVSGIFIELYHWNPYDKGITFSGLTLTGTPTITPDKSYDYVDKDATTAVALEWDPNNQQDYGGSPDTIKYSADNGVTEKYNKKYSGWMSWSSLECSQQRQTYYFFDRDKFNEALAIAKREGNSHKLAFTVELPTCVDSDGKPCKAQIMMTANFYVGGYKDLVSGWQEPGTAVTYTMNTDEIDYSSIAGFRLAIQNYWYYDAEGNVVEYPTKKDTDPEYDTSGNSIHYGTGLKRCPINPTAFISPIWVLSPGEEPTSRAMEVTDAPETTTVDASKIEGAGFHFFDFTPDLRHPGYGNAPEELTYITADENEHFVGGFTIKSPTKVNKQHQACFTLIPFTAVNDKGENVPFTPNEDIVKDVRNRMAQGLAYAKQPGANGMLSCDVRVRSAKNPADDKDCSMQMAMHIICYDSLDDVQFGKYVNVGTESTLNLNVSELTVDMIAQMHPMAQNYANVDQKTGNASGVTSVDVDFSSIYFAGAEAAPGETTMPADTKEADRIWALYNALPNSFNDAASFAKLEAFIYAYADADVSTQYYLETHYGLTMDDYGALLELYNSLGGFIDDESVDTGAMMPVAALLCAAAAGFVMIKSRKR